MCAYFTRPLETTHLTPICPYLQCLNRKLQEGVIPSTIRAHRLTMKAYRLGGQLLQLPLLSAIFQASTSEAKDIGSLDVLSDAAETAGVMSKQQAIEFLKGDELKEEVIKMAEDAKLNGVKGVPITIIEGKWALSGGQKAEVFVQASGLLLS
jgi:predicted DsbA family dithiol-disulfide isomerase